MTIHHRILGAVAGLILLSGAAVSEPIQPQIAVTGQGRISVVPDMARISLGVAQSADTADQALALMNAGLQSVLDQLTAAGIEATHVQTGNLRLNQMYDHSENTRRLIGYEAASTLDVQVYDLEILGAVLDAVVRDGANQMNGLSFDVEDRTPHITAARQAAVADAQAKATLYADAAAVTLGQILLISEGGLQAGPSPMIAEASFDSRDSVPIASGELSIDASINMVWALGE